MYAQPLVVGTSVYVATENNTVYAFNTDSGAQVWSQHLASPVVSGLPCGLNENRSFTFSSPTAQKRSVSSSLAEASVLPSGAKATA